MTTEQNCPAQATKATLHASALIKFSIYIKINFHQ